MPAIKPIDIVIAGVQKAATSSLKNYMSEHPEIQSHGQLEFAFFVLDEEYERGYEKMYYKYFGKYDPTKKILIKNVGIIFWEECMVRLHKHNPSAKIIIVLRNPVDRAFSAYWYARMRGYENIDTFEKALEADPNRLIDKIGRGMVSYYERGHYSDQINNLYKYFKKENVKIILQEEMKKNLPVVVNDAFIFCGVENSFIPAFNKKYNESSQARSKFVAQFIKGKNPVKRLLKSILPSRTAASLKTKVKDLNKIPFKPPVINPETKSQLQDYYKSRNKELAVLINRDLSDWDKQ